jgi:hypothetical protein
MRVCVHTANLGGFDEILPPVAQLGVEMTYRIFTDADFPPRPKAMSRRLQARIPKIYGWDLEPGFDAYFWHDASLQLSRPDSVAWFLEQLDGADMVVFRHPWRNTAEEEAAFLRMKTAKGSNYILSRYEGEDLDGQMRAINDGRFVDDRFYASGAFIYRPTLWVQAAMRMWWEHTSRFHCIDQLAMPYVLETNRVNVRVIDEDIYHASHLAWTRRHRHG